jgi:hypothetical protein
VDQWWPFVARHIRRWLDFDGAWTEQGVKEELKAARAQLWCMYVAGEVVGVWVTRIENTDSVVIGLVWGCAGDFARYKDDAISLYGNIEDWFREKGCKFIDWSGRAGWMKLFPSYTQHAIVMRKRL